MNCRLVLIAAAAGLCGLGAFGEPNIRPAGEYLRGHRSDDSYLLPQLLLYKMIEEHGSERPETTVALIRSLDMAIYNAERNKWILEERKYELRGKSKAELAGLYSVRVELMAIVDQISCGDSVWKNYLDLLNMATGNDLSVLASSEPAKMNKSQRFLLHYGRIGLRNCLLGAVRDELRETKYEKLIDLILGPDRDTTLPDQIDHELQAIASGLNATLAAGPDSLCARTEIETNSHTIVEYLESNPLEKDTGRLEARFVDACEHMVAELSERFIVFNLARLLMPEEAKAAGASSRFLKLNEYNRICSSLDGLKDTNHGNLKRDLLQKSAKLKSRLLTKLSHHLRC